MTIHLTIWWLWWTLISVYVIGLVLGMFMTLVADDLSWWHRPFVLVWPAALLVLAAWHGTRFMIGKE